MVKPDWNKILVLILILIMAITRNGVTQHKGHFKFKKMLSAGEKLFVIKGANCRKNRMFQQLKFRVNGVALQKRSFQVKDTLQLDFQLFRGKEPEVHTIKRRHIWLFGGIVATSWGSFWLRQKANDYYDKYAVSKTQKDIRKYWDKTRKYDTMANISLGISAILFAYLVKDLVH